LEPLSESLGRIRPPRTPARIVRQAALGAKFRFQGDEHGAIMPAPAFERMAQDGLAAVAACDLDPDLAEPGWPAEGAIIWLQPGHVDPTVNLHDAFWVVDERGRIERWPIDARRVTG
jgi:3-hydroxy-D-aspartate aldolase